MILYLSARLAFDRETPTGWPALRSSWSALPRRCFWPVLRVWRTDSLSRGMTRVALRGITLQQMLEGLGVTRRTTGASQNWDETCSKEQGP